MRTNAIARQLFNDEDLLGVIGMASQLRIVDQGSNGALVPGILLKAFKAGTTAKLRRDKFIYTQLINSELANIERVRVRQSQFVAGIGLFMFTVSNLFSLWLDRRIAEYEWGDDGGSL